MTQVTKSFTSDRGTRLLNLELRRLEEDPQDAATSCPRIIRAMHAELMQISSEILDMKADLARARKHVQELSQQLVKQEDLQAAKEYNRTWAIAAARKLRTNLKMAQRRVRQKRDQSEQLRKYATKQTVPVSRNASNGLNDT